MYNGLPSIYTDGNRTRNKLIYLYTKTRFINKGNRKNLTPVKSKSPRKIYKFYNTLVATHSQYPQTVEALIENVDKWGYYKDLFFILTVAKKRRNKQVTDFVYEFIVNKIKDDLIKYELGHPISTLSKWMPRKGTKFDKNLDFVRYVCERLYPDRTPLSSIIKYRKTVVKLSKKINTTEINMCAPNLKKINFANVPVKCLQMNINKFANSPITKDKLFNHLVSVYESYPLHGLISKFLRGGLKPIEVNAMNEVWKNNLKKYTNNMFDKVDVDMKGFDCVLDLSKNMFDRGYVPTAISVGLLCLRYGNNVIINGVGQPMTVNCCSEESFEKMVQLMQMSMIECNDVDLSKFAHLVNKPLIVVTNKQYVNQNVQFKNDIRYWVVNQKHKVNIIAIDDGIELLVGGISEPRINKRLMAFKGFLNRSDEMKPTVNWRAVIGYGIGAVTLFSGLTYYLLS